MTVLDVWLDWTTDEDGDLYYAIGVDEPPVPPTGTPGTGPFDIWLEFFGEDAELFGGAPGIAPSVPIPFVVSLAGHAYQLDTKYYARAFIDPFREARDTGALPGEQSLNPQGAWKRTRDDWSLGAGQQWADRDESSERRYFNSRGIDVWDRYQCSLLHDTEIMDASAASNLELMAVGQYLYAVDGATLRWTTDPDLAVFAWDAFFVFPEEIADITTDGNRVFVAVEGSLWMGDLGTDPALMAGDAATHDADVLTFANGWLFGAKDNVLSEIRADGTVTEVMAHANTGFVWSAVTGSPSFIYATGQAFDINEVYKISVAFDGRLAIPIYAGGLPRGERMLTMLHHATRVVIGTSSGLAIAAIDGDGSLSIGPRIELDVPVSALTGEGSHVWFGWTNFDLTHTGVGRINLSEFTFPEVPAYASDLMLDGGSGVVSTVARFGGRTYFGIDDEGYVREVDALVPEAFLDLGRFRWATFEPKTFLGVEIVHPELEGAIDMTVRLDNGDSVALGMQEDTGTGLGQVFGLGAITDTSDWFAPLVTLRRSDFDDREGPIIHRFTIRALPIPKQVEQIRLPIVLGSTVNVGVGEGQDQPYDVFDEYQFLRALRSDALPVRCQQGVESLLVVIRNVEWAEGLVSKWNAARTGLEGVLMVTAVTMES